MLLAHFFHTKNELLGVALSKPQAASRKPQAASRKPQAASRKLIACLSLTLLATLGVSSQANAALTDGLVAHWSFDDCTAKDNSGNGHNGVFNGDLQCVDGKAGKALSFNGFNTSISVNDDNSAFTPDDLTVLVWINPKATQVDFAGILDKSHSAKTVGNWVLQGTTHDKPNFYFGYCTAENINTNTKCSSLLGNELNVSTKVNDWNHLVFVKQGGIVTGYLNGKAISSMKSSFSDYRKTNQPLFIGAVNGWNRYFNGLIDEARIYNRALSADEVQALYSGSTTTPLEEFTNTDQNYGALEGDISEYKSVDRKLYLANVSLPNDLQLYQATCQQSGDIRFTCSKEEIKPSSATNRLSISSAYVAKYQ
ncbi:MAG: LamG domain-containing protein, partial [Methylococcales bacterium]|nr:LamG domain-containing protein [Methylococcales bacterium]